ncbi:TPA: hypothetical protein HA251_07025 [Candidatus Woesearchaeota archaeon]|nr:hypothetical protein [Candidatus Woesearchaeota archaeon]
MTYSMKNGLRNIAIGATLVAALGCSGNKTQSYTGKLHAASLNYQSPIAEPSVFFFDNGSCAIDTRKLDRAGSEYMAHFASTSIRDGVQVTVDYIPISTPDGCTMQFVDMDDALTMKFRSAHRR